MGLTTTISQTLSKGAINDENSFLNSIGKGIWDVVTNIPYEPTNSRIEKIKVKEFSGVRRQEQEEEKGYTNTLKSVVEIAMKSSLKEDNCGDDKSAENSNNEDINLMAKMFSKF